MKLLRENQKFQQFITPITELSIFGFLKDSKLNIITGCFLFSADMFKYNIYKGILLCTGTLLF